MRKTDDSGEKPFGTLDHEEKTIDIPGDEGWPYTAKRGGDEVCNESLCDVWEKHNLCPNGGDIFTRSR